MNILIQLAHPAQFHLFRYVAQRLIDDGHEVHIIIKTKDILEELLKASGLPYSNLLPVSHRKSKLGFARDMLTRIWRITRYVHKHHIDLLMGTPVEVAQVGWLTRKPSINFGEDDAHIVPLCIKTIRPFVKCFVAPTSCNMGPLEYCTVHYAGYQKLAYLHPNQFTPDREVVERYLPGVGRYYLLRFAQLNAYHDEGIGGFDTATAERLIELLKPHGRVLITAERPLEKQFECYRLHINPLDIHHIMAFADLYVGDSQSMAVEAAVLGVPGIRFNDFAGRIGVLEELEHHYRLTTGIRSNQPEAMLAKVKEWLADPNLRDTYRQRREAMLKDKIDVTAFFTDFVEKYDLLKP